MSRILAAAQEIMTTCAVTTAPQTAFKTTGLRPNLQTPPAEELLPLSLVEQGSIEIQKQLAALISRLLASLRFRMAAQYDATMAQMVSLNGITDESVERRIASWFETSMSRQLEAMRACLSRLADGTNEGRSETKTTRSTGFAQVTMTLSRPTSRRLTSKTAVHVLETAFSRSQSLTARECTLVAEAAGLSHQQVSRTTQTSPSPD